MATPEDIKVAFISGAFQGTSAQVLVSTPVDVWGWSVWNGQSTAQTAAIGETTSSLLPLPYATGHSQVSAHGYKLNSLAGQVTHTNMTVLAFYTPYQQ